MGTATSGGREFKERTRVSGKRPTGATIPDSNPRQRGREHPVIWLVPLMGGKRRGRRFEQEYDTTHRPTTAAARRKTAAYRLSTVLEGGALVFWAQAIVSHGAAAACICACAQGVRVRMGFHVGMPMCKESPLTGRTDYFGRDVNYAARVASVGTGGQIIISSMVVKELLKYLSDESNADTFDGDKPSPFGLEPGHHYNLPALGCSVEYLGKVCTAPSPPRLLCHVAAVV